MHKSFRLFLAAALSALVLLLSGCASSMIGAASTRIELEDPADGKSLRVALPKNISADEITLTIPTSSGKTASFKATNFASDASTVIDRASVAQAQALGKLAEAINSIASLRGLPVPASPPAAPAEATEPAAANP